MKKQTAINFLKKHGKTDINWSNFNQNNLNVRDYLHVLAETQIYGSVWLNTGYWYTSAPVISKECTFRDLYHVTVESFKRNFLYTLRLDEGDSYNGKYTGPKCEFQIVDGKLLPEVQQAIEGRIDSMARSAIHQRDAEAKARRIAKEYQKILETFQS